MNWTRIPFWERTWRSELNTKKTTHPFSTTSESTFRTYIDCSITDWYSVLEAQSTVSRWICWTPSASRTFGWVRSSTKSSMIHFPYMAYSTAIAKHNKKERLFPDSPGSLHLALTCICPTSISRHLFHFVSISYSFTYFPPFIISISFFSIFLLIFYPIC